jgi:uncharacterized membrane protein YphA (DoxX/SURF4 family)
MTALERSLEASQPRPTLLRSIVFRFAFVYWGLYCALIVCMNTFNFTTPITNAIGRFAVWVGKTILGISYAFSGDENGSGDKTSDWVLLLCVATIATIATTVWSMIGSPTAESRRLREAIRIAVRYTLAFSLLAYGISKLFLGQFPLPTDGRLMQRFGDASPMGLMWTFMGASPLYVLFSGAMETLGAALLLFRRTTTLGALVVAGVMLNVAMLNFCYDVPVKLASTHYFAMAIFLMLPDARRLANVLVLNRVAEPVARDLVLPRRWMRVTRVAVKCVAIAAVLYHHGSDAIERYSRRTDGDAPKTWYDGTWSVASFHRNGREVPDSTSEPTRWTRLRFQIVDSGVLARWRLTGSGYGDLYKVVFDEKAQTIVLTFDPERNRDKQPEPGQSVVTLGYVRRGDDHLDLDGQLGADHISVQLERVDTRKMLLLTRGFHWINEVPFNR